MTRLRDWTMTVADHGNGRMLVEVREDGRLTLRRTVTADDVAIDNALGCIVADALRARWDTAGGGGR